MWRIDPQKLLLKITSFAKIGVDIKYSLHLFLYSRRGIMKNKRLIIVLCVLAFLTVLIVINSTLFTLQNISVNWLTSKCELTGVKDYDIVGKVSKGGSIFLVDKEEISENLEKKYPYLRVVSIETKFPNKIVIHSAEREALYAIKLSDSEYAVLDEKGKVLSLESDKILAGTDGDLGNRPIKVVFNSNVSINAKDFEVGKMVGQDYIGSLLSTLSYSLRESNYTPTTSKGVLKEIEICQKLDTVTGQPISVISFVTRNGIELEIEKFENKTTDKLLMAFARYDTLQSQGVVSCRINVFEDGGIVTLRDIWE